MTAERDRRGRSRAIRRQAAGGAALIVVLVLGFTGSSTAAQPNQLLNGRVEPAGGTTNTTITFSVRYFSTQGNVPTSVTAVAGNVVIPLTLESGTAANGRYSGSAKLPAGTWPVLFQASAKGFDPSLEGPDVTITRAPTPTPRPTPKPTPKPTAQPTAAPTAVPTQAPPSAAPQTTAPTTPKPASSRPSRSPRATASATAQQTQQASSGRATPTPEATEGAPITGGTDGDRQLVTILTGGLIAIGALALIGFFAILRDRRRRARDARLELLPEGAVQAAPAAPTGARPPARSLPPTSWERDFALDQEPIGTVEYQPPPTPDDEAT